MNSIQFDINQHLALYDCYKTINNALRNGRPLYNNDQKLTVFQLVLVKISLKKYLSISEDL